MDVCVDHRINVLGLDSSRGEPLKKVGVQMSERRNLRAITVIAGASVNQNRPSGGADHPSLNMAQIGVGVRILEVGRQQWSFGPPVLGRGIGQDLGHGLETDCASPLWLSPIRHARNICATAPMNSSARNWYRGLCAHSSGGFIARFGASVARLPRMCNRKNPNLVADGAAPRAESAREKIDQRTLLDGHAITGGHDRLLQSVPARTRLIVAVIRRDGSNNLLHAGQILAKEC